jgi:hypothetical protein
MGKRTLHPTVDLSRRMRQEVDLRDDAGPHFVNSPDLENKRDGKDIWAQRGYIWATADQKKKHRRF